METEEVDIDTLGEGEVVLLDGQPCIVTDYKKSSGGKGGSAKVTLQVDCRDRRRTEPADTTVTVPVLEPQRNPTITVGGDGHFDPAVVAVAPGTSVTWFWSGSGGTHRVVAADGRFESDGVADVGYTFQRRFDEAGAHAFVCENHGDRGVVVVDEG